MLWDFLFFVIFTPQGDFSVEIYHFPVPLQIVPITVVYGHDKSCDHHMTHLEATSELIHAHTCIVFVSYATVCVGSGVGAIMALQMILGWFIRM